MILIITHKQDYTADYVIDRLNALRVPYLRLNCEDILHEPLYHIKSCNEFEISFKNDSSITSVWYRRTQNPEIGEMSIEEKLYFFREFESLMDNICCSLERKKWLSDPHKIRKAENKVLQLIKASELNFIVPKTLISNSKKEIMEFFKFNYKTIIKPIYSGYVPENSETSIFFTSVITKEHISSIDDFDLSPCIFQEYIEKDYELRVTVVDDKVFAAKVDSQKYIESVVDWRKARHEFKKYELPEDIATRCVKLCKSLGLNFGAIDLIRRKNGEYVFLEINPNGQWAWIEMDTNLPISEAIINFLKN